MLTPFKLQQQAEPQDLRKFPEHSEHNPLSVHSLTVAYHHKPVLWDVDYDAPRNSLIAIVGPNGAGKTTFIKACLGLIPKVTGVVEYWGQPYRKLRSKVGYVPQRESVDWDFPISAQEVVSMGRYRMIGWFKRVSKEHKDKALHYLDQVGLADFAHRQINQLSGGQQQRVFLARALAQEADLYFMDEPFAGVDAATEKTIVEILHTLKNAGKTVICVHHDLMTISEYFDSVMMINTRLVTAGKVSEVYTPENLKLTYGGRLNMIEQASWNLSSI